ncbi:glucosamine-6-phosphate deaminase [Silvibacterium bohemicum]|uniref:Glucosamine-6-phosphate deaminase n=1 Tax=Silvibacterium bohemicum TaxID=1577686 RepID=A0A841K1X8_9BACT|nr:glucosamine-6-phosphate deaminase [Silvibacterium bohemicum]MBB6144244.1 glucosamine-6-phosphate deaminase [Silvibacterium bohemicum]
MNTASAQVKHLQVGNMKVEIHPDRSSAGAAAALAAAKAMKDLEQTRDSIAVIFATGASQFDTLESLTSIDNLPWNRVRGFHMDEYIGISPDHPASFRRYLREKLTSKVRMKEFFEVDGSSPNPKETSREYAAQLHSADPQLCLLGIGENGHLAFNDPPVADFNDPLDVKVVRLDAVCRQQQMAEGWFKSVEEVPEEAITLTIPALFRVPKLIASVPGKRKAKIVRRTIEEQISTACPATLLRTHPDVTVYLDTDSASELDGILEGR